MKNLKNVLIGGVLVVVLYFIYTTLAFEFAKSSYQKGDYSISDGLLELNCVVLVKQMLVKQVLRQVF